MSKTFTYGRISTSEFEPFIRDHFISELGATCKAGEPHHFTIALPEPLFGLLPASEIEVVTSSSELPERTYEDLRTSRRDRPWILMTSYGRPADLRHPLHEVTNWIDGEDLRTRFYPLDIDTANQPSLICSIHEKFADGIIPQPFKPRMFAPDRLQIRTDNVYYRAPDRYKDLRRGSGLFLYVTAPASSIRGVARIQSLLADTPQECLANFGNMGVFTLDDLNAIARKHRGKVLALSFDWYRTYNSPRSVIEIRKSVPNFDPQSAAIVTQAQHRALDDNGT